MARRSGLGKGIGALIPTESTSASANGLIEVPVAAVEPNPYQPRDHFDEAALTSLAESIRVVGVIQPVLVRPKGEHHYELIAGERRWRAARRAGLATIPAVIREVEDLGSLEQALVENLHRQDLNPLEEAAAYQQLIEDFGLTQEDAARRVGRSRSSVANLLRLFQLPPTVQKLVGDGALSAGHAKALLGTPDRAYQETLAKRIVQDELSVRETERLVRERAELEGGRDERRPRPAPLRPPGLLELEELLSARLDTRVSVSMGASKGKVSIEFANLEDLERIYRLINS